MTSETRATVYYALGANLVIATAKLIAAVMSGSSAMGAETAHSLADTMNEVFLLVALSTSGRPADVLHPFGHGKERYFWALLATGFLFVAGAAFSLSQSAHALLEGGEPYREGYGYAYGVLAVALCADALSLRKGLTQTRREARLARVRYPRYLRISRDPTVKLVVSEDAAGIIGVLLAAAGLGLHQWTGDFRWDALASGLIGLLLAAVAVSLAVDIRGLLIGEAATPSEQERMLHILRGTPGVQEVTELMTMAIGPHALLVTARVRFAPGLDSSDLERIASDVDRRLKSTIPDVTQVFIAPVVGETGR